MDYRTCTAGECENAATELQLCPRHHLIQQRYGTTTLPELVEECINCGDPTPKRRNGPRAHYCSTPCRRRVNSAVVHGNARAKALAERTPNPCSWCGEPLPANAARQTRFHPDCRTAYRNTLPRDSAVKQCTIDDCERPLRARGMCSMHWKRWGRATGRIKAEPWDDRRRDNYHRRRARLNGATNGDKVLRATLIARDNGQCQLCGHTIDLTLTYPHPRSASIDHRIPISKGGEHSMANTQLSCLECNVRKSDRIVPAA